MTGFRLPTRVHMRPGCLNQLPDLLSDMACSRVMLMMDPGLAATEWPARATRALSAAGITFEVFDEVEANPRTTTAENAAATIRNKALKAVIGIGGGSVLDAAKGAAMLASNPGSAMDYVGKNRYPNDPVPFIAVPSTCGTGSEVTWVSVLTHEATRQKISIKGDSMFPNHALVDADLLCTLPANLIAWTGMDALTHALEATTGKPANPISDALAEKAIGLMFHYLPRAVRDISGDNEARLAVARAATLAGMAFGNADVGGVHCLSETIGALWDVPHGLGNAILLPPVMRFHRPYIETRPADLYRRGWPDGARQATDSEDAGRFLERLDTLSQDLAVPDYASLGIGAEHHQTIAAGAVANGSNVSNPQTMRIESYLQILRSI